MSQFSTTHGRYSLAAVCGVFVLLLLVPSNVVAIPISQYQQNLNTAISTLQALNESPDDESEYAYYNRMKSSVGIVRLTLPENQPVEFEGETCNVDNAWLHKDLDELEKADDPTEKLGHIVWTLYAIQERVAERQNPGGRTLENKQWAKTRLESILARPEYATGPQGSNALARLYERFVRWLANVFPRRRAVNAGRVDWITLIAQIIVIAIAVAVLVYVIKTLVVWFSGRSRKPKTRKKREPRIVLGERLEPDATASDLLSEAEALARQGDLRAAIRKAYIALLVELGDRKLISLAHHKTNRDYLNSLRSVPQLHSRMRGLTDSFERHWYGFASATPNDWQDFRAGYLAALRSETN